MNVYKNIYKSLTYKNSLIYFKKTTCFIQIELHIIKFAKLEAYWSCERGQSGPTFFDYISIGKRTTFACCCCFCIHATVSWKVILKIDFLGECAGRTGLPLFPFSPLAL